MNVHVKIELYINISIFIYNVLTYKILIIKYFKILHIRKFSGERMSERMEPHTST